MSDQTKTDQTTYRVIRGSLRIPRGATSRSFVSSGDFVHQGDLVPSDMFDERDIASWLDEGRIEVSDASPEQANSDAPVRGRGRWTVDPSSLVGKSFEDLLIQIQEMDPDFDANSIENEQAAVRLLTSDWHPSFAQTVPAASDRSRPAALALNKLEQTALGGTATRSTTREPSPEAARALESAKSRAQAPSPESGESVQSESAADSQ